MAVQDLPFTIFKRKNSKFYVVRFKDKKTGKYLNTVSTKQTDREEAKKYCFHAWRHYYASYMKDRLSEKLLQSQTGHKTVEMLRKAGRRRNVIQCSDDFEFTDYNFRVIIRNMKETNTALGTEWQGLRKEIFTPEELRESELKTAIVGELIEAREQKKISQKRLEELSGVKQPVIARMESGRTNPRLDTILKILAPLGKTLAVVPIGN